MTPPILGDRNNQDDKPIDNGRMIDRRWRTVETGTNNKRVRIENRIKLVKHCRNVRKSNLQQNNFFHYGAFHKPFIPVSVFSEKLRIHSNPMFRKPNSLIAKW